MIRIGTVCSGVEAPMVAAELFGLPHEHVFSCEINKECQKVIRTKFDPPKLFDDIAEVDDSAGGIDVLIGGLPCQSFSQIGQGKGLNDSRGNMYLEFCRILRLLTPEWFVVENVRNLMTHDSGKTYEMVSQAMEECGYELDHRMMRSSDHGVPQGRKRVYIVGRRGAPLNYQWPEEVPLRYTFDEVMGGVCERDCSYTLRVGGRSSGYEDRHNWDQYKVNGQIVELTVEQACRLQGFPDGFYNGVDVSNSAKFAQMGNAMTVDVVGAVMGNLHFMGKKWIDWPKGERKWRELAKEQYQSDGEVEIDEDATVSISEDSDGICGAYVQAWVFVDNPERIE